MRKGNSTTTNLDLDLFIYIFANFDYQEIITHWSVKKFYKTYVHILRLQFIVKFYLFTI